MAYTMTDPNTGLGTNPGNPDNGFWIDGKQYEMDCGDQQMTLGSIEDWQVTNDSSPNPDNDRFGSSLGIGRHPMLGVLGDIDGDGRADLCIGAEEDSAADGTATLLYSVPPLGWSENSLR